MIEPENKQKHDLFGMTIDDYLMLLHFSQFLAYIVPFAGVVAPVVLWVLAKDDYEEVDKHGKMIVNWTICAYIYGIVGGLLCIVLIGFPIVFALGIMVVVFPIIGGVKAKEKKFWKYPLTISFL